MLTGDRKRKEILAYIIEYKTRTCGESPTFREIAAACGLQSVSTVSQHLAILVKEGKLELFSKSGESLTGITVVGSRWIPPESTE